MKVLIYVNKAKDSSGAWLNSCIKILNEFNIDYKIISDEMLSQKENADAMFVLGGDGTILNLTQFASNNSIPLVGINAGKLGFLTEFEQCEMREAVSLLKEGLLIRDERTTMSCFLNGFTYFALNDLVLQRVEVEERGNNVTSLDVEIDGIQVEKIIGDGVVVSTPTGSTAYSLSAGGAILAPATEVFSITPIAAHSFNQRGIVYSNNSSCEITLKSDCATGLFVDGIFVKKIFKNEKIVIRRNEKPIVFLRKDGFNFYKRLSQKLKDRTVDN